MNKLKASAVLCVTLFATGCANKVHTYATSTENTIALRGLAKQSVEANIGEFTDSGKNESKIMCRLSSPVGTPEGKTFATYIRDSIVSEMVVADLYDDESQTVITANLNDIYGSTVIGNAYWEFDISLSSSNGNTLDVKTRYDYESSYLATSACSEMQRSFVPAVQKLNTTIFSDPNFPALLK
ncbi:hypothetical protein CA267_016580 [Alteromonas pelagimontana]|uniref:Lipoprotein n=1 Tax=Alteromonas pelagimontana TaxID=1858656 RepID=A0A6M4MGD5_9ALTE|nr:hypothetical protein [Alteromonas pelagimontana]QJR82251.1 hypothetical protein CA267_016580 [Alteromonas pelagimontana]